MSETGLVQTAEGAPHPYQHVGSGRWVCPICRVFIVNVDCQVNRDWLSDAASSQATP